MRENILSIATILIFFAVGLYCLFGAKRMQRRAIEAGDARNVRLFRGYIRSKSYVVVARIAGFVCVGIGVFLLMQLRG